MKGWSIWSRGDVVEWDCRIAEALGLVARAAVVAAVALLTLSNRRGAGD